MIITSDNINVVIREVVSSLGASQDLPCLVYTVPFLLRRVLKAIYVINVNN